MQFLVFFGVQFVYCTKVVTMTARYISISDKIINDIDNGVLALEQRMPSLRKFTQLHDISMTTANNSYQRLLELGWLTSKPQVGYFVSQPLNKQTTPQYPYFATQVRTPTAQPLLNQALKGPLYTAQLPPQLLPQAILARCLNRANRRADADILNYPDYQGALTLRTSLAEHFSAQHFPLQAQQLVITNGCIDALRSAIDVTSKPGDAIAVSSPCFNGLLNLLQSLGRVVIEIPCYQSQLDLQQLEILLQQNRIAACLFSANHINPQGFCLSNKQKQQIAELAQQYQTPVIEDDIYLELSYSNSNPLPIKYWDNDGWIIWCSSISKTVAPGYRIGWCAPGRYFKQYLHGRSAQFMGVNTISQNMLSEFINSGQYIKHLKKLTHILALHAVQYHKLLRERLPKQTKISVAEGGMVIWLQLNGMDSKAVLNASLAYGIAFRAGHEFTTLEHYQDCLRLNIGWPIVSDNKQTAEQQIEAQQVRDQLILLCRLINENVASH